MAAVNKAILVGRLGKDVEYRTLDNGGVANFTIATSETYKDKSGEKKESTQWHNIVAWGKLAELASKYLSKGDAVYVEGKITNESYEKDGAIKYITKIVAKELVFLSTKGSSNQSESSSPMILPLEDDLPF